MDRVAWSRRVFRGLGWKSALATLVAVALLAGATLLFAQSHTGTANLGVQVAPAVQLTTNGTSTVSLWIRLTTGGTGSLWGDSTNTCNSPISGATTYSASGKYNNIPLSSIPFTSSNTYVCAYDPGAASPSAFVLWPHTPASLAFSQQPSNTVSGASISPAVTVQVLDSNGLLDTSSTASVTLAIGTNPGGGTLSGTVTQSAVNGVATFSSLSLNKAGTGYTLTAASTGLTSVTSNAFNITSGAAAKLTFITQPSTTTAGSAISPAVTVQVQDVNGNLVTTDTSNVTIAINGGGVLSGGSTLTVAASGGVATFSNLLPTKSGSFTLSATDGTLTGGTSNSFTVNAGAINHFAISAISSPQTAGTAFNIATITAQDANNNTVTGFTSSVTFGGTAGVTGTSSAFTAGILSGASVTPTIAGSNLTVTATDGSSHTGSATITTVNPGPLDHFKVEKTGGGTIGTQVAGTAFGLRLTAQDVNNNTVTSFVSTATLTSTGALTGSPVTSGSFVAGVLDPQNVTITNTGSFTITATASGKTGTSNAFTVNAGALDHFLVEKTGGGAIGTQTAGTAFSLRLTAQDVNNNTVTSFVSTAALTSTGTLTGSPLTSGSFVAGVLDPQSVTITNTGSFTITATASGKTGTSAAFTVNPGALDHFKVEKTGSGTIGTQVAGTAFGLRLTAQDVNNNTVTSFVSTATLTSTGALTGSPVTSGSFVAGVLDPQSVTITNTGSFTTTATAFGKTGTSNAFTVNAGAATKLVFTTQPGGGTGGTAWTVQPVVTLQDANGNTVTGTSQNVTLAIQNNAGPGGVLSGTATVAVNTSTGLATFSGLSINKVGTGYTLTATGSTVDTTAGTVVSGAFNIAVGAATQLVFTTSPTSCGASSSYPCSPQPVVTVEDAGGNSVTSDNSHRVLLTPAAHTLTCNQSGDTMTVVSGVAAFTGCYFTSHPGTTDSLTASSTGLTSATSSTFALTGVASQVVFVQQPTSAIAGATITPSVTAELQDSNGDPVVVSGVNITLSMTTSGTLSGTLTQATNSSGLATFSDLSINLAGSKNLTAASTGLTAATSSAFSVTAGVASASVSTVSTSPTSVVADGSTTSTITVTAEDAFGNPESGDTVTLTAGSGSSTITPTSGTTNASGVVTFAVKDSTAQAVTYTATDTTDSITITQTAQVTFTASKLVFGQQPTNTSAAATITPAVTVQLQDGAGNNVSASGVSITLSLSTGTGTLSGTLAQTTNSSGLATFNNLSINLAGSKNLTAARTGLTSATSTAFTITAAAVSAIASTVSASPTSVVADGVTTSTVTVTLNDANSNPVSGKTVSLTTGSGSSTITTVSGTTNSSGQATFTVKDTVAQAVVYTAMDVTDGNLTITQTATVTFTPGAINHFAISAISSPQTAGTAFSIATITAQDANNNTVTGFISTVTFGGTAGVTGTSAAFTAGILSGASVTPTAAGSNLTVTVTDGSSHTGSATITTINAASQTITVTTPAPASAVYGGNFTVAATASSGLAVTYSSAGGCSNAGATFTMTSGTTACTVKFDQAGNATYSAASEVTESVTAQKAPLTVSGITANTKVYDGAVTATLNTGSAGLVGVVSGDSGNVTLNTASATGAFSDRNVGTSKIVTVSGLTISGTSAGNYTLTQPTTTATITAKALTITGSTASAKAYDGTTAEPLGGTIALLTTETAGTGTTSDGKPYSVDSVAAGGTATGAFASKNVGTALAVTVTGVTITGTGTGNYTATQQTGLTANIATRPITVTAATNSKTYDGTTSAAAIPTITSGTLASGDTANFTEVYSTKDVGSGNKTLVPSGTVSDGNSGNNYAYTFVNVTTGTITAKALTMGGLSVPASKVYNGTAAATASGTAALQTTEALGTGSTSDGKPYNVDSASLTGTATATYNSKDVASATTVTFGGLSLTGTGNGNYTLTALTQAATITAKALTATGFTESNKLVDGGTTAATPTGSAILQSAEAAGAGTTSDGKPYTGDTVSVTGTPAGTFASSGPGTGITVTITGLSLTGAQGADYSLTPPTTTANIVDFSLSVAPTSVTEFRNNSYTNVYQITLTPSSGAIGSVTLGCVSVTPSTGSHPVTCSEFSFNNPIAVGTTGQVGVNLPSNQTFNTYTITFEGTSGTIAHNAGNTVTLVVQ